MTIINIAVDLFLTIILSVSMDIIGIIARNDVIRTIIQILFSVGIIMVAIRCRYRFGMLIGFAGYFLGGFIREILLNQYFVGWKNMSNVSTYILYGLYYYLIGVLYKIFIDREYFYKGIIIFCSLIFFVMFILIGLGTIFTTNHKLFIYVLGDKTIIMNIIFYCIMVVIILFGILSLKYVLKNYKRRYVA
jgi:hypothetical protein